MTSLPEHFFIADDGTLYDTRSKIGWHQTPLRAFYRYTFGKIDTVAQFKATLRNGPFAWPGGYPLYFITSDGAALSFDAARENARQIFDSIANRQSDGWRVVACDINYEDSLLTCDHSGQPIPSAYGDEGNEPFSTRDH